MCFYTGVTPRTAQGGTVRGADTGFTAWFAFQLPPLEQVSRPAFQPFSFFI